MARDEDKEMNQPLFGDPRSSFSPFFSCSIRPEAQRLIDSINQLEQSINQAGHLLKRGKISSEMQKKLQESIVMKTEQLNSAKIKFAEKKEQLLQNGAYYSSPSF